MTPTATIYSNRIVTRQGDGAAVHYAVDMDLTALDGLAIQAAQNKRKLSRVGPLTVRVVSVVPAA
jgi:hypothetical protein